MKFSNFEVTDAIECDDDITIYAKVDMEIGFWFFKKKERIRLYKDSHFWKYLDNGEYTPSTDIENTYSGWKARNFLTSDCDVVKYIKKKRERMPE